MTNACVCCGAIIPEGRQICPACERKGGIMPTSEIIAIAAAAAVTLALSFTVPIAMDQPKSDDNKKA